MAIIVYMFNILIFNYMKTKIFLNLLIIGLIIMTFIYGSSLIDFSGI